MPKRKLIEVALPLEAINRESAREKSIRHGHPSTLHLWWARRPLAAARAVLFAQLVDDPSSHPDKFPTEEAQRTERERLHNIIERLVVWENIRDEKLLAEAKAEIRASCDGNPPPILDPFAGGGTIPLEAQRLGLEAHASDLNPVAVLINKALIEIPPKFRDKPPVFPGLADGEIRTWKGAEGLAADVSAYGQWTRDEAEKRIGHLYPKVLLANGVPAKVIAWIWARTVMCGNPACNAEVPLISSLVLSRRGGTETWLRPTTTGKSVSFQVTTQGCAPQSNKTGQGARFNCWVCGAPVEPKDVHAQLDQPIKPSARLLAVVADSPQGRVYLDPDDTQRSVAESVTETARGIRQHDDALASRARGTFGGNAQGKRYGFFTFADYFSDRQLVVLTTFCDLVAEARSKVLEDALAAGLPGGQRLETGGTDAEAYADAIATYLGLAQSGPLARNSTLATWDSGPSTTKSSTGGSARTATIRTAFSRQALAMTWDFAEGNLLGDSGASFASGFRWFLPALSELMPAAKGEALQRDAAAPFEGEYLLSTDPPYYDNIGYSDLSDFFYVWQRRALREVYPSLLATVLVPKAEELVANQYRHGGKEEAKEFFENGFRKVFINARSNALPEYPITVYYAFKQSEGGGTEVASTGWETLLDGMIRAGWAITATWPMRSELSNRILARGTNALASSILLALRPRPDNAPTTDRRGVLAALHAELPDALRNLQQGKIAPVDLPQAAIGPGMAVFSRYAKVVEPDGSPMTVRSALARINEILDQVLAEQEGDFDAPTRFAIAWYRQNGYAAGSFGQADDLARARNTSVELMDRHGILTSRAGKVTLKKPADMPADYDVLADTHASTWEALHHTVRVLESGGIGPAGGFLAGAASRPDGAIEADLMKELAFLLFSVAEKNGWTKDALSFNALAQSWPDIVAASRGDGRPTAPQGSFEFDGDE